MRIWSCISFIERVLLDLFFPRTCIGCGREGLWVCKKCQEIFPKGRVAIAPAGKMKGRYLVPFADRLVRESIHTLKYNGIPEIATILVSLVSPDDLLCSLGCDKGSEPYWIPVPIGKKRRKKRGFNQAELLARALAKHYGGVVVSELLVRDESKSLVGKGKKDRCLEVKGAFRLLEIKKSDFVSDVSLPIILVDDVLTTGSTLAECGQVLERGIGRVPILLAIAHGQ